MFLSNTWIYRILILKFLHFKLLRIVYLFYQFHYFCTFIIRTTTANVTVLIS